MLEFRNVTKKFGERTILNGISFLVPKGQILFVLGTSGTGKSVLLKSVVGLLKPTTGEILVDGKEVQNLTEEEYLPVRKNCGMVFQHPALFDSLTVFENVAFGVRKHQPNLNEAGVSARVHECLGLVQLHNISHKMPTELSYGMQKRVSLARTVAVGPEILLFDEPTTGLDPVTTNSINQLILNLSRKLNSTSVVVSHDMHCALAIADHILVLDKGHIIDQGSAQDLRASKVTLVQEFLKEALESGFGESNH